MCDFLCFYIPSSSRRGFLVFGLTVECLFCKTVCLKFILLLIIKLVSSGLITASCQPLRCFYEDCTSTGQQFTKSIFKALIMSSTLCFYEDSALLFCTLLLFYLIVCSILLISTELRVIFSQRHTHRTRFQFTQQHVILFISQTSSSEI